MGSRVSHRSLTPVCMCLYVRVISLSVMQVYYFSWFVQLAALSRKVTMLFDENCYC